MNDRRRVVREIFMQIAETPAEERAALLDRLCGDDAALRRDVEELLRADRDADADGFMNKPTGGGKVSTVISSATEKPGMHVGPYKLLELIGEGGFGSVYVAEQEKPVRRRVALKVIKLGMDTKQVIARFEAERQALAMMDHPNIARVLDAGTTDSGRPWFAMELVRGVPITEYCDTANLTASERLELFAQVCHAVQHAHQKGVIHRDIKPSNVLVTLHDGKPVPKVIDFGIAKAVGAQLTDKTVYTLHRQLIGTPAYMSPEQAEMSGLDVDTRADVYSLGVLLYELLTGSPPFAVEDLMKAGLAEMQRIIREVEPVKPSTRVNTLGTTLPTVAAKRKVEPRRLGLLLRGDLDWIAMKCLEKDRTRRYETANALADDVKRHLNGEPVVAAPPSAAYRMRKFVRKHKRPVIASAFVSAALMLAIAAMAFAIHSLRRLADSNSQLLLAELANKLSTAFEAYRTRLLQAHSAIRARNLNEARLRLNECDKDLRGWEWEYLSRSLTSGIVEFPGNPKQATFDKSGKRVITSSGNGIAVYDLNGARVEADISKSDASDWQFNADRTLAVTAWMRAITIWDSSGNERASWNADTDIQKVQFDRNGRRILVHASDAVHVLDGGGTRLFSVPHSGTIASCDVSVQDMLLVIDGDGVGRIWDRNGRTPVELRRDGGALIQGQFAPDGATVLTQDKNPRIARLWNLDGSQLAETDGKDSSDFQYNRDGSRIVTWSRSTARLLDAGLSQVGEPLIHGEAVYGHAFSRDSSLLLTWGTRQLYIWDAQGRRVTGPLDCGGNVQVAIFNPSSNNILALSEIKAGDYYSQVVVARRLSLWNLDGVLEWSMDLMESTTDKKTDYYAITYGNIEFSSDGSRILVHAGVGDNVYSYLLETSNAFLPTYLVSDLNLELAGCKEFMQRKGLKEPTGELYQLTLPLEGTMAVSDAQGNRLTDLVGHAGSITSYAVVPDGSRIVTTGTDRSVRFWDTRSWREAIAFPVANTITSLQFSPSGDQLFLTDEFAGTTVWDIRQLDDRAQDHRLRANEQAIVHRMMKNMFAGKNTLEQIEQSITDETARYPIRGLLARQLFNTRRDEINHAAQTYFSNLKKRYLTQDEVQKNAERGDLSEHAWQRVQQFIADWRPDPSQMTDIWRMVCLPTKPDQAAKALQAARDLIRVTPHSTDANMVLACALYRDAQYDDALKALEIARQSTFTNRDWLALSAMCQYKLGQKEQASQTIDALRAVLPGIYRVTGSETIALSLRIMRNDIILRESTIYTDEGQTFAGELREPSRVVSQTWTGIRISPKQRNQFEGLWSTNGGTLWLWADDEGAVQGTWPIEGLVEEAVRLSYGIEWGAAPTTAGALNQWAMNVIERSSEYGNPSWAATQVLHEPDTTAYGDIPTAWTHAPGRTGREFITVGFEKAVFATGVTVRETFNNGFVRQIDVMDEASEWHTVWKGDDLSVQGVPVNCYLGFEKTAFLVKAVKVTIDAGHTSSWEEIDAVMLHGILPDR